MWMSYLVAFQNGFLPPPPSASGKLCSATQIFDGEPNEAIMFMRGVHYKLSSWFLYLALSAKTELLITFLIG
jgi:hypothetical protein